MKCANLGYADNMQQLLPRALLNVRDYEGQTALMHAIESKHQHCIDLLLRVTKFVIQFTLIHAVFVVG